MYNLDYIKMQKDIINIVETQVIDCNEIKLHYIITNGELALIMYKNFYQLLRPNRNEIDSQFTQVKDN